jgi:cellulose synthase operon protein C
MSSRPDGPDMAFPWPDRGERARPSSAASPRSGRDLEILRSLARRIPPNDASAHNNLGVVYYNKGLHEEAVRHFERALELDPRMQVAERNLQICYFNTGHFLQLTEHLQERLEVDPGNEVARDQLARTYFNSGDLQGAVRELRELLRLRPQDADVYQRLARAELKRGNSDAALSALRRSESLDPGNGRIKFLIGEMLYQRGLAEDARSLLEEAIELEPGLADAYHVLAFVYGDLDRAEEARHAAARAVQLNPSYARAEAGLSLDSYSAARYEELIGGAPASPMVAAGGELAHYSLGLAFRQKALFDEALREFRLATERGEDNFLVQQAQAELLLLRGDSAEALRLYEVLVEQEPASPKLWNEIGVAQHQAGQLEAAEQAYRRALEIDGTYSLAWSNLGVVRHHRSEPGAEAAFRSALGETRALPDAWRNMALLLQQSGRMEESVAAFQRALDADPDSASAAAGMGVLLLDLGRAEEARSVLLRAVESDPELAEARYHLAFALSALGDYQGALRETKVALELNPYIPVPRFRLLIDLQFEEASVLAPELDAAAHISGSDAVSTFVFQPDALDDVFGEAAAGANTARAGTGADLLGAARRALEHGMLEQATAAAQHAGLNGADRTELLLLQGEIFLRRELSGEAVERFNDALGEIRRGEGDASDDALRRALHGAARSLLELGRLPEAVEAAERLVDLVPDDLEALRTLGNALSRVHDYARAAIVLEQARLCAPDDVNLLTQLGAAYAAAGDPEGAESALRRAIAVDAFAIEARTTLADILVQENRTTEAEVEYREALRALPTYGAAAFGLASMEERRGRPGHAINVMIELLTRDPYRTDALRRLGELLESVGRPREARYAYERALRFDPLDAESRAALDRTASAEA